MGFGWIWDFCWGRAGFMSEWEISGFLFWFVGLNVIDESELLRVLWVLSFFGLACCSFCIVLINNIWHLSWYNTRIFLLFIHNFIHFRITLILCLLKIARFNIFNTIFLNFIWWFPILISTDLIPPDDLFLFFPLVSQHMNLML